MSLEGSKSHNIPAQETSENPVSQFVAVDLETGVCFFVDEADSVEPSGEKISQTIGLEPLKLEEFFPSLNGNLPALVKKLQAGESLFAEGDGLYWETTMERRVGLQLVLKMEPSPHPVEASQNVTEQKIDIVIDQSAIDAEREKCLGAMGFLRHEMGTPLNTLIGFSQLLESEDMFYTHSARPNDRLRKIFVEMQAQARSIYEKLKVIKKQAPETLLINDLHRSFGELTADVEETLKQLERESLVVSAETAETRALISGIPPETNGAPYQTELFYIDHLQKSMVQLRFVYENMNALQKGYEIEPEQQEFDARELVDAVCKMYPRQHIEINAPETFPVCSDEKWLRQVLVNLLNNAQSFSPRDGVITVECVAIGEETVQFSVADQGPGVPQEDVDNVFNKFHQSLQDDRAQTSDHQGLGLAVVKKVTKSLGGVVSVGEAPGGGAKFYVTIPRGISREDEEARI